MRRDENIEEKRMKNFTAVAALSIILGTILAIAASSASATFSPAGTALTATSTGSVVMTVGNLNISCTTSVIKAVTANPVSSTLSTTGGANVTFSQTGGCPVTMAGIPFGIMTFETHNTWDLVAGAVSGGSAPVAITIPNNAASIAFTPSIGSDCTITFNASSLADVTNTYTNATTSLVLNDTTIAFTGSASPCPTAGSTLTIMGQYSITNTISVT
jgi:hypothetical protein